MFTVAKDTEITPQLMCGYVKLHNTYAKHLNVLHEYYTGNHEILRRVKKETLANNKVVINHARYITLISAGYMCGSPVTYQSKSDTDLTELNDWIEDAELATQDMDLATDQSKYGLAYELGYIAEGDDGKAVFKLATVDPRDAFVVYENNVTFKPVAAVYYYPVRDLNTQSITGYDATLITESTVWTFKLGSGFELNSVPEESVNTLGMINLYEVYNNKDHQGDFEQEISLIDAYDKLMSDRLNDKEQFVDALMVLKGATLGDDDAEKASTYRAVKNNGVMELDGDASVEFLARQLDENGSETLRKAIVEDIGRMSCVPQMLDENFSGNSSGVALSYKFFPLDQIIKVKEKYFRECIKNRLKMFNRFRQLTGQPIYDLSDIKIKFKHILPANTLEEAQKASMLNGIIPDKEVISCLSFIDDPEAAADEMQKQKQESAQQFMNSPIIPEEPEGTEQDDV